MQLVSFLKSTLMFRAKLAVLRGWHVEICSIIQSTPRLERRVMARQLGLTITKANNDGGARTITMYDASYHRIIIEINFRDQQRLS